MKVFFLLIPLWLFSVPFNDPLRDPAPYYISGDAFRVYSDFVFDEVDKTLDPKAVTPRSTVFVNGDFMEEYFEKIHSYIDCEYILITHNSDNPAPGLFVDVLEDPKLIGWFAIHVEGEPHPKLHPIPLGIANRILPFGNVDTLKKVKDTQRPKEHLLYFNFTIQNHFPERWGVYQIFNQTSYCYRPIKKRFEEYLGDVLSSKFVLSPRGVGVDTYRTWETLYLGSFPIVRSSALNPLYEGLPVVVIEDWKEINEKFLDEQYEKLSKMKKTYRKEQLNIAHWTHYIDSFKTARASDEEKK